MQVLIIGDGTGIARQLAVALNSLEETASIALNYELTMVDSAPPASLMLIPPGSPVVGRDGRAWNNPLPAAIVQFFRDRGVRIPIDIEHATEIKGPNGEPAPAQGWCVELEAKDDGSIWASVEWNIKGAELVTNREYSYYSPAIIFDKTTMNIVGIKSVGLTNTPNFAVPALNSQQSKEDHMNLATLLAALGLAATATFDDALNSIGKMKGDLATALNHASSPPLDKFVPKADYDLALNRATTAEGKLADQAKEQLDVAINTEITAALAAGKITPATKDYHVAQCRQEGGLERFRAFAAAAPVVADTTGLDKKRLDGQDTALNAEEQKVAGMFGNSADDISKYGK